MCFAKIECGGNDVMCGAVLFFGASRAYSCLKHGKTSRMKKSKSLAPGDVEVVSMWMSSRFERWRQSDAEMYADLSACAGSADRRSSWVLEWARQRANEHKGETGSGWQFVLGKPPVPELYAQVRCALCSLMLSSRLSRLSSLNINSSTPICVCFDGLHYSDAGHLFISIKLLCTTRLDTSTFTT